MGRDGMGNMRKPKLPFKEIYVPPTKYKVQYSDKLAKTTEGQTFFSELRIDMNPRYSIERQRATVLHEALHAIFDAADTHHFKGYTAVQEEKIINSITPILLETLRQNPCFVRFLLRKPKK